MLNKKTIDDLKFENKKVLLRCDFNVPLDNDLNITDNTRLVASIPTIQKISNDNAKLILCSHLGKPKGEPKPELSLEVVANALSKLLNKEVKFLGSDRVIDDNVVSQINSMQNGDIVLLQNTRYRAEEEKNEDSFSKELASICDAYVNDAFGTAHRAHSSTAGVARYVSETAVGYLIQKEIDFLGNAVETPKRPFVAILGGSKVSSKISVINALLDKVDKLIIGGGMAYTFMKAMGHNVGNSLLEEDYLDYCNEMIAKAKDKNVELLLPVDAVIADAFDNNANTKIISTNSDIEDGWMGLDIGPDSEKIFGDAIKDAATIIWNGPMGCFEMPNFASGTIHVARAMAESKAITIIGGGDSAAACNQLGFGDKMTHISTGGGASLEFLEGKELPGISVIQDK